MSAENSPDAVKWMRATVFMPLTLKENSTLTFTHAIYHQLAVHLYDKVP